MKNVMIAAAMMLCVSVSGAAAKTIDFSGLANGALVTSFDFGDGLTGSLTVTNGPTDAGEARIFDTTNLVNNDADPDLVGDFTNVNDANDARGFGNALIIQERADRASGTPDDERRGGSITFVFDQAIDLFRMVYLDGEEGAVVFANMSEIGSFESGTNRDNKFTEISFLDGPNTRGITQFKVEFGGSGAIGEFDARVSVVPVPAALPLLLAGLGAFGAIRRKQRRS